MKSSEIYKALTKHPDTRVVFIDAIPADLIPKNPIPSTAFVVNTHTSHQEGEHWISLYFKRNEIVYIDPYGLRPHRNILARLKSIGLLRNRSLTYMNKRLQGTHPFCGHHCIYTILTIANPRYTMDVYTRNYDFNDRYIYTLVKSLFDV
jgi:hypothetical protein